MVLPVVLGDGDAAVGGVLVLGGLGEGALEVGAREHLALAVLLHVLGKVGKLVLELGAGDLVGVEGLLGDADGLLVDHGVGIGAQGDDVVAAVQDVGALLGAPGGHLTHGELDFYGLGGAGGKRGRLGKAGENHGGLLDAALGVRGAVVDLDDVLALDGASVGNGGGHGHRIAGGLHGVQRLGEGEQLVQVGGA